jgi:hypothetical protein
MIKYFHAVHLEPSKIGASRTLFVKSGKQLCLHICKSLSRTLNR